jgi:aryl-alcohol dehydrogenase-like predicted oxidoreductase
MDYVRLGGTGLRVSRLCLGMMSYGAPQWRPWVLDEAAAQPFLRRALELGINFFDTADMYSLGASEEILGRAIRQYARREDVVLATKVFYPMGEGVNDRGLSRKHILASIDGSLRRLGSDYVDLYQIHRFDEETPIEETLEALNDVVRAGKARYVGASTMKAWQFSRALHLARQNGWARFVSMQNYYNLIYREEEREMIPLCQAEGVGIIPYSPLARGWLAGGQGEGSSAASLRARTDQYAHKVTEESDHEVAAALHRVAGRHGRPAAQIALAWLLGRPGVTAPIIGATKLAQLEDAAAALTIRLTAEDIAELEKPYAPHPAQSD